MIRVRLLAVFDLAHKIKIVPTTDGSGRRSGDDGAVMRVMMADVITNTRKKAPALEMEGMMSSVKKKKKKKKGWVVFCLHTIYFYEMGYDVMRRLHAYVSLYDCGFLPSLLLQMYG